MIRARGRRPPKPRGMNRIEQDYAGELEVQKCCGEIADYGYERIRLRLGPGAWYKPDFDVIGTDGFIEIHETKGYWREAARVRIKVAAGLYPHFRFLAIYRDPDRALGFRIEEIEP